MLRTCLGRRLLLVATATASVILLAASPAGAAASPPGNANWILLDGTCNGQPAQLLDPRGGNTAFLVGGSVGVGKHFRATNAPTGEVLEETFNGRGIADDRLFSCTFLFEDVPTPSGTIDILFEVWGVCRLRNVLRGRAAWGLRGPRHRRRSADRSAQTAVSRSAEPARFLKAGPAQVRIQLASAA